MNFPFTSEKKFFSKKIGGQQPFFLIAGPCVMENRELLWQTAEELARLKNRFDIEIIFKSSFDKANRSAHDSFRGPGLEKGLQWFAEIKAKFAFPLLTDIHESSQVAEVAEVTDVLQIPAFLCRQTDLLLAAAASGKWVNIKKGQFLAPQDAATIVQKMHSADNGNIFITERGYTFGYNNLVVDMRALEIMRRQDIHVIFDATHSTQLPGGGKQSGGQREMSFPLARAAAAAGVDGFFTEVHPTPEKALSDASNQMRLQDLEPLLDELLQIDALVKGRR